jgi:uncharacterized protein YidB (DUF937 family)
MLVVGNPVPPRGSESIVKKNILAIGVLTVATLSGAFALAATGLVGTAGAQTPTTAEQMVTGDGGGHGLFARFRAHRKEVRQHTVQLTADTIGISTDDLKAELKSGKSIADVATAHGVDPQTVITAIDNDVNSRVDQAVADGKLTQQRGDTIKDRAPGVNTQVVDHVFV